MRLRTVFFTMDLQKMIHELQAEKERLDEAILALERLSAGKARRRGRPPGWLKSELDRVSSGSDITQSEESESNGKPA